VTTLGTSDARRNDTLCELMAVLAVAIASTACASTAAPQPTSAKPGGRGDSTAVERNVDGPPALFYAAPWRVVPDRDGDITLVQDDVQVQFPPKAGSLARASVRVYDRDRKDVGVQYRGQIDQGDLACLCMLSVFVYPADASAKEHLEEVKEHLRSNSPSAKPIESVIDLDAAVGVSTGAHAAFSDVVNSIQTIEQVSVYRRGRWFLKFRVSVGPADHDCGRGVTQAVRSLRARTTTVGHANP
jgi:hypothetical protein